jgi:hypothetical protein
MTKTGRDKQGNLIDRTSHATHAMNPIDRAFYEAQEWEQPPARHIFRCMFCGALDDRAEAARPCRWTAATRR